MTRGARALAFAVLPTAALATAPSLAAGELEVREKAFEAGRVALGTQIEHVFELSNRGSSAVRILDVKTSCGCTASEYPERIAAGESVPLRLTIDTTELEPGPQSKTATVTSDAAKGARVVLQIKLDVYPPLEILPRPVLFFESAPGSGASRTLLARSHDPALEVLSAVSDNEMITVKVAPAAPAPEGRDGKERPDRPEAGDLAVEIGLVESAPAGLHKALVSLKTNLPGYPESVIRVSAVVSD